MKKILYSNCCSIKSLAIATTALVAVLIGILVLSFYGIPRIIDTQISASVRLKTNTDQWKRFIDLPIPIITKVYLYNITNAEEIMNGAVPEVQEIGPYVFRQKITKKILSTDNKDDSVTYQKYTKMEFDQALSGNLTINDTVVVVNAALLVLAQITTAVEQMVVTGCLDKIFPSNYNSFFMTSDIHTLMFEGYIFAESSDDVGYACNIVRNSVIEKSKTMRNIDRIYFEDFPDTVQALKFSFLGFKTKAPDGIYTVGRGIDDVDKLGTITKWNNSTRLPFWGRVEATNNDTCQLVRGGDSTLYPPHVTKDQSLDIFSTDICRSVKLFYKGEDTYKGITGLHFEPNENIFRPQTPNPINDCFCTQMTANPQGKSSCYLNGIIDSYPCFGVPILLSFPHFLYADDYYIKGIKGVSPPDAEKHGIYLLIEPNTGTPLQGKKRIQLNLILRPAKYMPFSTKVSPTVLPIIWIDEGADLSNDLIDMLNNKFFKLVKLAAGIKYGLIAVSAAAVLATSVILFRKMVFK